MWVVVDSCDDEAGVLFGRLDNEPLLDDAPTVGDKLAVSYGNVVEHRKASGFRSSEGSPPPRHRQRTFDGAGAWRTSRSTRLFTSRQQGCSHKPAGSEYHLSTT
jgi:hypothetical protein